MLRRVLDTAGLPDQAGQPGHEKRDAAARLLIGLFEQGIKVESQLMDALQASMSASAPVTDAGYPMPHERPHSGPTPTAPHAGGYRYGKRIELNGTWTIYHVFSGVPAEYAAWKMVGLNVTTAARALRILNTPATAHAAP